MRPPFVLLNCYIDLQVNAGTIVFSIYSIYMHWNTVIFTHSCYHANHSQLYHFIYFGQQKGKTKQQSQSHVALQREGYFAVVKSLHCCCQLVYIFLFGWNADPKWIFPLM